jgi:hypothetical protein
LKTTDQSNPSIKQSLHSTIDSYMQRAEKIKEACRITARRVPDNYHQLPKGNANYMTMSPGLQAGPTPAPGIQSLSSGPSGNSAGTNMTTIHPAPALQRGNSTQLVSSIPQSQPTQTRANHAATTSNRPGTTVLDALNNSPAFQDLSAQPLRRGDSAGLFSHNTVPATNSGSGSGNAHAPPSGSSGVFDSSNAQTFVGSMIFKFSP